MPRIPAAERRNDFVRAAVHVIATYGVDGATTRRIAEEAHAPLASLHYCFSTKELLFAAVYDEVTRNYVEVVTAGPARHSVVDAACDLVRRAAAWYLRDPDVAATAIELILWARKERDDPAIRLYDAISAAIVGILRDAAGTEPVDDEWLEKIAYIVGVLSDGFAINLLTYGDRDAAFAQVDVVVAVLRAWISAEQPTRDATRPPQRTDVAQPQGLGSFVSWAPRASA